MFEMDFDDASYIYIKNAGEKSVIKLERNYEWHYKVIDGVEFDLGTLFSQMDIDELIDSFRLQFDVVERIDESEIDDWM